MSGCMQYWLVCPTSSLQCSCNSNDYFYTTLGLKAGVCQTLPNACVIAILLHTLCHHCSSIVLLLIEQAKYTISHRLYIFSTRAAVLLMLDLWPTWEMQPCLASTVLGQTMTTTDRYNVNVWHASDSYLSQDKCSRQCGSKESNGWINYVAHYVANYVVHCRISVDILEVRDTSKGRNIILKYTE